MRAKVSTIGSRYPYIFDGAGRRRGVGDEKLLGVCDIFVLGVGSLIISPRQALPVLDS